MLSEGNAAKNGEPTVGFSFTTMLHHTRRFRSRISYKNGVTTLEHPPYTPDLAEADFTYFIQQSE
jgi:hypothetical protein